MSDREFLFSSESVSEGHPDKVCDQLSDAVVDACLSADRASRVACEALIKNDTVIFAGEITTRAKLDFAEIARRTISQIGYEDPALGFTAASCEVLTFLNEQSADISQGVTENQGAHHEQGAGDQGLMFGFACRETEQLMPLPIALSHELVKELAKIRKEGRVNFLRPDSKSQVTVRYRGRVPVAVETVVISTQHSPDIDLEELTRFVKQQVVPAVIPDKLLTASTKYLVNPTGRFVIGGPVGDCGLTGRKIIVDTYGGYSRHGGGAFSGKDPTKVDRSAAYAARYIAKNIVAAELAERCEVQLAYAIGVAEPVSVLVDTFGTNSVPEDKLEGAVREIFSLTPKGIIESLNLIQPIYRPTAAYGHFGREPSSSGHFSWERCDRVEDLQAAFGR